MPGELESRITAVRAFNRSWSTQVGALGTSLLKTAYSLTEARVLFEIAQNETVEVADLKRDLDLDAGYLSRILSRFKEQNMLVIAASESDARRHVVRLTAKGRRAFGVLDARSAADVRAMLARLTESDQRRLVGAMSTIQRLLHGTPQPTSYLVRSLHAGDYGWVVERHGALYAQEYGWDETFEVLVARIVADYVDHRDPRKDDAWIAEVDGERVGCVFCVKKTAKIAQLRILLVDPKARGMGIGGRLVDECVQFARRAGYERVRLWTNSVLVDARRVYERAGFQLVEEKKHHAFGHDLVGQTWELSLGQRIRERSDVSARPSRK